MKKTLFKNKEEHWAWVWDNYIRYYRRYDKETGLLVEESIWGDDLPKLEPFFDWQKENAGKYRNDMPPEVKESFDYYYEIREKGWANKERYDVTGKIEISYMVEMFGFSRMDDEGDDDELYNIYSKEVVPPVHESIKYPCVMLSYLETSWDRMGDATITAVDFVYLEDFEK
jgi:hypothetical protein